jgi:hypothetical protein
MSDKLPKNRPFWQDLLIILGVDVVIVLALSLVFGRDSISALFFWSSIILLVVAVVPIFSDIGASAKALRKANKEETPIKGLTPEQLARADQGARTTYLFGLAGFLMFLLAILTG